MCPAGSRNHQYRSDGLRPAGLHLGYISDAPIYRRSDFHAARHWSGICNEPSARDSQITFVVLSDCDESRYGAGVLMLSRLPFGPADLFSLWTSSRTDDRGVGEEW